MSETRVLGKYEVQAAIGKGPRGSVFRAVHQDTKRTVAIKVLAQESIDAQTVQPFQQVAKSLSQLQHPGIARLQDVFEAEGRLCLVFEFVQGTSLSALLKDGVHPEPKKAWDVLRQTLEALAFAHLQGAVHRDLKPANILLNAEGAVVLTDFGTAVVYAPRAEGAEFLSPEHFGDDKLTARSDIYQMGVIAYQLVTGKLPFTGTPAEVAHRVAEERPADPSSFNHHLAWQLDWVIQKALSKDPSERFNAAIDFAEGLRLGLQDTVGRGLPPAQAPSAAKPAAPARTAAAPAAAPPAAPKAPVAAPKPIEAARPMEPAKPVEAAKPAPAKPAETAKPAEAPKPALTLEPAKPAQTAKAAPAKLVEPAKTPEAAKPQAPATPTVRPPAVPANNRAIPERAKSPPPPAPTTARPPAVPANNRAVPEAAKPPPPAASKPEPEAAKPAPAVHAKPQAPQRSLSLELEPRPEPAKAAPAGMPASGALSAPPAPPGAAAVAAKAPSPAKPASALMQNAKVLAGKPAITTTSSGGSKPAVLFVDDDARILNSLRALFRQEYEVHTAESGEAALAIMQASRIQVVVSDQRMPNMTGVDLLRRIRTAAPNTVRMLLTGYTDLASLVGSINQGEIFRFVMKPWDNDELKKSLADAFKLAAEQATTPAAKPAAPRSAGSLLVIDPTEGVAMGLERLLAGTARVIRVETPAEAAKILSKEEIAALVADMGSGMDGLVALFREIRAKLPGVLSILLTDEPDSDLAIELINRAQIFRLLPKPVNARDLRTQVAEALRRYSIYKQRLAAGLPGAAKAAAATPAPKASA